jgi:hypothetical protein
MSPTQRSDSPRLDKTVDRYDTPPCLESSTDLKEIIMNAKNLFAAAALALIGTAAFAAEGEQFVPEQGSLTRSEVKAELARSQAAGEVNGASSSYGRFPTVTYAARKPAVEVSREDVRTEARAKARSNAFDSLYVGG